MIRVAIICAALGLAGCNAGAGGAPDVRAEVRSPFDVAIQQYGADMKLARQRRMTFVQAANRLRTNAHAIPGATFSDADELLISYIGALAAEVDARRMTPEMMGYKIQERIAANNAEAQRAAQDQQQTRTANTLRALQAMQTLQQMQQASAPAPPVPAPSTYVMPPVAPFQPRLQTTCTTMPLGGGFTTTSCN